MALHEKVKMPALFAVNDTRMVLPGWIPSDTKMPSSLRLKP